MSDDRVSPLGERVIEAARQPADLPEVKHWVSVPIPEHLRVPDGPVSVLVPRGPGG